MFLEIIGKCSDTATLVLYDRDGQTIKSYDGYFPDIDGEPSDYIELHIDWETGQIEFWDEVKAAIKRVL